ncbi:hypothetical protein ONZ45_g11083 [Pleurotus djamor]|nr:hypothetical protein ONZ45_g11083 [Pleurotus djamor]
MVSRTLYSIAAPRLYEAVAFGHVQTSEIRLVDSFCQALTKNNGRLGVHVHRLTVVLPLLTHLAHFELDHPRRCSSRAILSALTSSHLTTFIWTANLYDETKELVSFLAAHPSIEHLELPHFHFSSPLPSSILPRLRKLMIHDDDFLSGGLLRTVSHLSLVSLGSQTTTDDTKFEETYTAVEYFAALQDFTLEMAVDFCRRLTNGSFLGEFLDALAISPTQFQSEQLEYLSLCADSDAAGIEGIFAAVPTLRVIDLVDGSSEDDVLIRHHLGRTPILLPLELLPKPWLTEEELEQILA